jgi:hypothetical protein
MADTDNGHGVGPAFDWSDNAKETLNLPFDNALTNNYNIGIQTISLGGEPGLLE